MFIIVLKEKDQPSQKIEKKKEKKKRLYSIESLSLCIIHCSDYLSHLTPCHAMSSKTNS